MTNRTLPLVSVIIPTYNYGDFIASAIDSALSQTHENVELIVIDDGSTDNTKIEVGRYKEKLAYYFKENEGVSSARNYGVTKANGDYIVFLDADDILHQTYVEKTLSLLQLQNSNVAFAYAQLHYFEAHDYVTEFRAFDLQGLMVNNCIPSVCLIKTETARKFHYDSQFALLEDWDFYLTLAENGLTGVLLDEPLVLYRKHFDKGSALDRVTQQNKRSARHAIILKHRKLYGPRRIALHQTWFLLHNVIALLRRVNILNGKSRIAGPQ